MAEKTKIALALKYRPKSFDQVCEQFAVKQILASELKSGNLKRCLLFTGPAGCGKCLGKDTPILMYDGAIKLVQDIVVGDQLMGDDGTVRNVLSLAQGKELMYRVSLEDGTFFTCNKSHIITLIKDTDNFPDFTNVNVEDVYNNLEKYKHYFAVKFNSFKKEHDISRYNFCIKKLSIDEYFGFEIDGNKLFVLGNNIITHNTTDARIFATEIEPVVTNTIEINCADHTGVEDVRSLVIEPSRIKPIVGQYKIFILDECHMLTTQSQNALLKILEEPPAFCVYILCTTDPQKVLGTILSRAFRYDFQLISHQGIVDRLNYILESEKNDPDGCGIQSWDMDALSMISTYSKGHMRDAITTVDKLISFTKNITVQDVENVLGVTSYELLFNVLDSIIQKNENNLIQSLESVCKSGMDLKLFAKNFLAFVLDANKYIILKNNNVPDYMSFLNIPRSFENRLMNYNLSHKQSFNDLLKCLLELNSKLKWETTVKPVLETELLLGLL